MSHPECPAKFVPLLEWLVCLDYTDNIGIARAILTESINDKIPYKRAVNRMFSVCFGKIDTLMIRSKGILPLILYTIATDNAILSITKQKARLSLALDKF